MSKALPTAIGIVMVVVAVWWNLTSFNAVRSINQRIDDLTYDFQLKSGSVFNHKPLTGNVVIVDVDDRSLKEEGQWPWPRRKITLLVDKLQAMGVTAIAFDVIFSEKQENSAQNLLSVLKDNNAFNQSCSSIIKTNLSLFEQDNLLAASLAKSNTYLAMAFLPQSLQENVLPPPMLTLSNTELSSLNVIRAMGYISNLPVLQAAAKGSGFVNITPDTDGIIRHTPIIMAYKNGIYPSLALQTIVSIFGDTVSLLTPRYGKSIKLEGVKAGDTFIPTDQFGEAVIPFRGKSHTFKYYSATDILNDKIAKEKLTGKIVVIGTTAVGLGDLQATAIQAPFPGVEIQATMMESILTNSFVSIPAWSHTASLSFLALAGLLAAFLLPRLGSKLIGIVIFIFPLFILVANYQVLEHAGIVFSVSGTIITITSIAIMNVLYGYLFESRRREQLNAMFGQYVDKKHIEEMLQAKRGDLVLHSEDREMTVLFADIRKFTAISEHMKASELVALLNYYFTAMTKIILDHSGTIDKYVGDEIMAFWGAPLNDAHHAENAIHAAIEMQKQTNIIRHHANVKGLADIKIGVGINTGLMSVGDMGSLYRRNYTVLGDAVNLAARIESLSKLYRAEIIVSENTLKMTTPFAARKLDKVRVQGKSVAVTIYQILGKLDELTDDMKEQIERSNLAIEYYFARNWNEAAKIFKGLHKQSPEDAFYALFVTRLKEIEANPPGSDWDGIFTLEHK